MALPATETFAGAAAALGGSWTQELSSFGGTLNRDGAGVAVAVGGGGGGGARWNADTFSNSQRVDCEFRGAPSGSYFQPAVRITGADATFSAYTAFISTVAGDVGIQKFVNTTATTLATFASATFVAGDVAGISVSGRVVALYKNNALLGTASDTSNTSGSAGLVLTGTASADNWNAYNIFPPGNAMSVTTVARRRAAFW